MYNITLKEAVKITGKSKRTIQRYMGQGKLTYVLNDDGLKLLNRQELLESVGMAVTRDITPPNLSPQPNDERIEQLLSAVERLEKIVSKQSEQIASLMQIEHKPAKEPEESSIDIKTLLHEEPEPVAPTSDYLDGLTFGK